MNELALYCSVGYKDMWKELERLLTDQQQGNVSTKRILLQENVSAKRLLVRAKPLLVATTSECIRPHKITENSLSAFFYF